MTNRRRVDITIRGAWIEERDGRQARLYVRTDGGRETYLGAFWSECAEGTSTTVAVTDAPVRVSFQGRVVTFTFSGVGVAPTI